MKLIQGSGGKGGGSGNGPVEAADNLQSKQYARVLDLISEGEILGLIDGLKSVYLNDTVVENTDGSRNFDGVNMNADSKGTQSQPYISGFGSVESEVPVGLQILKNVPVVRTISDANIDALRVTISTPQLTKQDTKTGDMSGTSVELAIDLQTAGSGFVQQPIGSSLSAVGSSIVNGVASNSHPSSQFKVSFKYDLGYEAAVDESAIIGLQYRVLGSSSWQDYALPENVTSSASGTFKRFFDDLGGLIRSATQVEASIYLPSDVYEFRAVVVVNGISSVVPDFNIATIMASQPAMTDIINGKTTSKYQRSYRIRLTGAGPWEIRVRRLTEDSKSVALVNEIFVDSITEIVDAKLRYPNSALVALSVDSERFNSVPTRGYEMRGMIVKVPSNYTAPYRDGNGNYVEAVYAGIWNGSFKPAWTNNPAWCFYDLLVNNRYGLGDYIGVDMTDKWSLYSISQYCDELVDDGFGKQEPRFTCSLYMQTKEEAYSVISNFAAIFCSMSFWGAGSVMTVQDSPSPVVALFSPANVIDGAFNYSGSSLKSRHTVALVSWNDPADRYKQKVEYIEDREGIERFGIRQTEVTAVGCTSRGQAHRFGRRILYTERMETEVVSFKTGLEGLAIGPGEVIHTNDPVRAGKRMGGRAVAAEMTSLTLDAEVTMIDGQVYTLWVTLPDGTVESRLVSPNFGVTDKLVVTEPFSQVPQLMSMWGLAAANLIAESWRVVSIAEVDEFTAEITALKYSPNKYLEIEKGIVLEAVPTSSLTSKQDAPKNLVITETTYPITASTLAVRITVSWTGNGAMYELRYRKEGENWQTRSEKATSLDIEPAAIGNYEFSLIAINAIGRRSSPTEASKAVVGVNNKPLNVANLSVAITDNGVVAKWDQPIGIESFTWAVTKLVLGSTWSTGVEKFEGKALQANIGWLTAGNSPLWAAHKNIVGEEGEPVSVALVILPPAQPIVSQEVWRNELTLTWSNCKTSQPIQVYQISVGPTFASSELVGSEAGTSFAHSQAVSGSYTYWVVAIDVAGNQSIQGYVQVSILPSIDEALDKLTEGLDSVVDDMLTSVNLLTARDDFEASVRSTLINSVSVRVNNVQASVVEEMDVRGRETGELYAKYGVTVSVGGKVTGFRINASTEAPSSFVILTDRFAIATEVDGTTKYPFVTGLIDGVMSIGIDGNMYVDGTIKTRMLDAESVTADKIRAKSITAGLIDVDKLSALSATMGELHSGSVRGGQFEGYAWPDSGGGYYLGNEGLKLGNYSTGSYYNVTSSGNVYNAAYDIVNGVMTLKQLNVIDTINIRSNAISHVSYAATDTLSVMAHGPSSMLIVAKGYLETKGNGSMELWVDGVQIDWAAVGGGGRYVGLAVVCSAIYTPTVAGEITITVFKSGEGTLYYPTISVIEVLR